MQLLQSLLFILGSVWLLLALLLYIFQSRYIYFPVSTHTGSPADAGLAYEDIRLTTDDGVSIHGWFIPHPAPRATLLFLHGNGGNVSHRLEKLSIYHRLGLTVLIIDYRGYGLSEGKPSEQGTYRDAEAAWHHLTGDRAIAGQTIILYGESLGAGIASWLAGKYTAGALIIESAFTSIEDMGRQYYPYLPVTLLTRIRYPTLDHISAVQCPVLVIHSPEDEIVPYSQARTLYQTANGPRSFLQIRGDHNNGFYLSGEHYVAGLDEFIVTWF